VKKEVDWNNDIFYRTVKMRYRRLGKTGIKVSELSLGAGTFRSPEDVSQKEVHQIVRYVLNRGINYIDTAPVYGYSEEVLGLVFDSLNSIDKPFILSTKLGGLPKPFDPQDKNVLRRSVDESLRLLHRDTIDILMIHEPDRPGQYDWFTEWGNFHGPVCELLDELKSKGIIRYKGLAGTTAYTMSEIIKKGSYDVVLTAFNYSLLWQEALIAVIPSAKKKDMGIIIGSPFQHGVLSQCYAEEIEHGALWLSPPRREQFKRLYKLVKEVDISIAELSLRFLISNPDISTVLMGTKSLTEAEQNIAFVEEGPLTEDVLKRIHEIAEMVPFRPYEEPYKLPFGMEYKGPGHIGRI
jgi:aryl-alcohol dehydrogenase-like predicted oxidoreductase